MSEVEKKVDDMTKEELIMAFRMRCTLSSTNYIDAINGKSYLDANKNLFEPTYVQFSKFMNGYILDNEQRYTNYLRSWLKDESNCQPLER